MKIIDKGLDLEFLTQGYFFLSPSENNGYYIIQVNKINKGVSCLVRVFHTGIPQDDGGEIKCENGEYIAMLDVDPFPYLEIDIWEKYYFPKMNSDHPDHNYQWYHEDGGYPSNYMKGFYEVMQFAYDLGIKLAEIKPI